MLSVSMLRILAILSMVATTEVLAQVCVSNLLTIAQRELSISDTSVRRVYTLCPRTTFTTGVIVNSTVTGGQFPLNVRANMSIRCGDSGSRSNNCIITGGIGVIGSPDNIGRNSNSLIQFQGITFSELYDIGFFIRGIGRIEVIDCAFRNSNAVPNIYLETATNRRLALEGSDNVQQTVDKIDSLNKAMGFEDDYSHRELQGSSLRTTFRDCLFEGNEPGLEPGVNFTMINIPSTTTDTTFDGCVFRQNDYRSRVAFRVRPVGFCDKVGLGS
jgi:hypothetical protein